GLGGAFFETAVERDHLPAAKKAVRGVIAARRLVGGENEFGERQEFERVLILVLAGERVAAGQGLEYGRAGKMRRRQVRADVGEFAHETSRGELVLFDLVQGEGGRVSL